MDLRAAGDLLTAALDAVSEIQRFTRPLSVPDPQLGALWEPIKRIVPFAAAWIGVLDAVPHRYRTAADVGHDHCGLEYLESPEFADQAKLVGLHQRREPMGTRPDAAELSWRSEHWGPPGCREVLAVPLVAQDGRHLGLLALHADSPAPLTDGAFEVMGALVPMISAAVDPISAIAGIAQLVGDAQAFAVVSRSGMIGPLPGMPTHPLLTGDSDVVATALESLRDRSAAHCEFLCPYLGDGQEGYVRVTALACPPTHPHHLVAVVAISPTGDLCGLTPRELVVLGLVVDGCANQVIATRLLITERTVAAHLEHIRAKLHAPTRTAAAVHAMRRALYLPYRLTREAAGSSAR